MKKVAHLPYLKCRDGVWYYRRRVPDVVREALGKTEIVVSFKTANRRDAARAWAEVNEYWELELERLRDAAIAQGISAAPTPPDEAASAPKQASRTLMTEVERIRHLRRQQLAKGGYRPLDKSAALRLARAWFAEQADIRLFAEEPDDPEVKTELIIALEEEWDTLQEPHHPYTLIWTQRAADVLLEKYMYAGAPGDEAYRHLTVWLRRAMIELVRQDLDRIKGTFGPIYDQTFQTQGHANFEAPLAIGGLSVSEAAKRFWAEKERKRITSKTRQKYRAALDLAVAFLKPEAPFGATTREQCKQFTDLLRRVPPQSGTEVRDWDAVIRCALDGTAERCIAFNTRTTYYRLYREFMEWGLAEGLIRDLNIGGIKIERQADDEDDEDDDRRPFTVEELRSLFAAPLFTGYAGPGRLLNVPGDIIPRDTARFWLPLLGLWTGARLGELCQLREADVRETAKGTPYIRIVAEEPPMHLKTKSSKREVPLHPELVRLGFLDFVAARRKNKAKWLFEDMLIPGMSSSHKASKQFASFLVSRKLKTEDICFHSFRHGFSAALKNARVPELFVALVMGWNTGKMTQHYGKEGSFVDTVYEDVCKAEYGNLDLRRLYP